LEDRIGGVTQGRVMPDLEQVTIGSAKQFRLAVLFLDICHSSQWLNWTPEEQKNVLRIMNIFMAEMINIVSDFSGQFEKNTGDGLMAYFGHDVTSDADKVKPAVEAATVMHYINDTYISPFLGQNHLWKIPFRVGIDLGPVTIARVGIRGQGNSIVAIGTAANIACKLMNIIPEGGICIGHEVYEHLPNSWSTACSRSDKPSGFVYVQTQAPYPAWILNYRLTAPFF
jgi:class 3 adenylate cyclase